MTAIVLMFAGCGDGGGGAADSSHEHHGHGSTSAFGEPGIPSEADREIEVEALDSLAFEPDSVDVQQGQTVTFTVTNSGSTLHEFVLGDESFQQEHASGDMGHHDEAYAVTLPPGETKEVTWRFTESGSFEYACHVEDHYDGGMRGEITVAG